MKVIKKEFQGLEGWWLPALICGEHAYIHESEDTAVIPVPSECKYKHVNLYGYECDFTLLDMSDMIVSDTREADAEVRFTDTSFGNIAFYEEA